MMDGAKGFQDALTANSRSATSTSTSAAASGRAWRAAAGAGAFDGEICERCDPLIGLLHRGTKS